MALLCRFLPPSMHKHLKFLGLALLMACGPRQQTIAPTVAQADEAAAPSSAAAVERQLAQQSVDAVIYHHASAETYRLFQQGYELARLRLDANLAVAKAPPAVIVDVDETVLDNSKYQVRAAYGGTTFDPVTWTAWCNEAAAPALPGALEFLNYAAGQGCTVFYITNRNEAEKEATVRNLAELGFPNADAGHVRVMTEGSDKTARRAAVKAAGYEVVLLLGDQLTDFDQRLKHRTVGERDLGVREGLADSLAQYFILLPNPMYGTWLDFVTGRDMEDKLFRKNAWLYEHTH